MRIGIIASIWISVPPKGFGFGAQEYLAYYIAEGLKNKGHEITLFATGDSKTSARLISVSDRQVKDINFPDLKIKDTFELMNLSEAYKKSNEFDIIHNHLLPYGLLFDNISKTPTVHTLHHEIHDTHADVFLYKKYKDQNFISISNAQRLIMPQLNYVSTVYNGTDTNFFSFKPALDTPTFPTSLTSPTSYMLYIGRLKKYKGIHTAIKIAKELGVKLKIAAPLPYENQPDYPEVIEYFEKEIKPEIKSNIEYIDHSIENQEKIKLIQNAKLLIFPVERPEPFGMTVIEAMSCGVPVAGYAMGAIPEIIADGKTGYLITPPSPVIPDLIGDPRSSRQTRLRLDSRLRGNDNGNRDDNIIKETGIDGLTAAVDKIYKMPDNEYKMLRKNSREHAEKMFNIEQMVNGYEKTYFDVLDKFKNQNAKGKS